MDSLSIDGLTIADDSFAEVTLMGVTKRIDLYRLYSLTSDYAGKVVESHPGEANEAARQVAYLDLLCAELERLGFGPVGHRAADKFDAALAKAVDEMGKADAAAPTPA